MLIQRWTWFLPHNIIEFNVIKDTSKVYDCENGEYERDKSTILPKVQNSDNFGK